MPVSTTRDHPVRLVKIKDCTLHDVPFLIHRNLAADVLRQGQ